MHSRHYVLLLGFGLAMISLLLTAANPEPSEVGSPNLIITDNVIEDNGFGIYVGWTGEWISEISGNLIADNGEGIRIVNKAATIFDNVIQDNITGVRVTATHQGEVVTEVIAVSLFRNVIAGNSVYGLQNLTSLTIDARDNWWGSPDGPLRGDRAMAQQAGEDQIEEAPLREWRTIILVFELPSLFPGDVGLELKMSLAGDAVVHPQLSLLGLNQRVPIEILVRNSFVPRISPPLILRVPMEVVEEATDYGIAEIRGPSERISGPVQYADWRTEEFSPIPQPEGQPSPAMKDENHAAEIAPEEAVYREDIGKPENDRPAGEGALTDPLNEHLRDRVKRDRTAVLPEDAPTFERHTTAMGLIPFTTLTGADFTSDDNMDLALAARHSRQIFLLVGDGSGEFDFTANFDSGIRAEQLWSADINDDGHLDLILVDNIYAGVFFLLGYGDGTFSLPLYVMVGLPVSEVLFIRSNAIMLFDFILVSYQGNSLLVYHVEDDTSFSLAAQIGLNRPRSPVLGDFNGDGYSDIAVITNEDEITVLLGRQGERMDAPAVIHTAHQRILDIESSDFNNDGLCDIIFSSTESSTIGMLIGTRQGDFEQADGADISEDPVRLVAVDFDKDGNTDLAAILPQGSQVVVLRGRGDGSFLDGSYFFIRDLSSEFYIGDFDNDNLSDIVMLKTDGNRLTTLLQER